MAHGKSQGIFAFTQALGQHTYRFGREIRQHGQHGQVVVDARIHVAGQQGLNDHTATAFVRLDLGVGQEFLATVSPVEPSSTPTVTSGLFTSASFP